MTTILKRHWPWLLVLALAVFFRFYRFTDFQFWSIDDENFAAPIARFFVGGRPSLVVQNTILQISMGPFFYLLSLFLFGLSNQNPVIVDAFSSALGVLTALFIYFVGTKLGGWRVGFLAGILYAGSFLVSLFDRRWWVLSLDPIISLIALWSVSQIRSGKYYYSLPLAIAASFAWHSDPTILVVILFVSLVWLRGLIPRFRKEYLLAIVYLLFSLAPLMFFEARHTGAISSPILQLFGRILRASRGQSPFVFQPLTMFDGFLRAFFAQPSVAVENYLVVHCREDCLRPPLPWLTGLVILALILLPLLYLRFKQFPVVRHQNLVLLYFYLLSFFIGISLFLPYSGGFIYPHYYLIVWPVVFLLCAFALDKLLAQPKVKFLALIFLATFLISNLWTLRQSQMLTPLRDKIAVVNYIISRVPKDDFGLTISDWGHNIDGEGGLLFLHGYYPKNESYYAKLDWVYRAYSLYGNIPTNDVSQMATVSLTSENALPPNQARFGHLLVTIVTSPR